MKLKIAFLISTVGFLSASCVDKNVKTKKMSFDVHLPKGADAQLSLGEDLSKYMLMHFTARVISSSKPNFAWSMQLFNRTEVDLEVPTGPTEVRGLLIMVPLPAGETKASFCSKNPTIEHPFRVGVDHYLVSQTSEKIDVTGSTETLPLSFPSFKVVRPSLIGVRGEGDGVGTERLAENFTAQPFMHPCNGQPINIDWKANAKQLFKVPVVENIAYSFVNVGVTPFKFVNIPLVQNLSKPLRFDAKQRVFLDSVSTSDFDGDGLLDTDELSEGTNPFVVNDDFNPPPVAAVNGKFNFSFPNTLDISFLCRVTEQDEFKACSELSGTTVGNATAIFVRAVDRFGYRVRNTDKSVTIALGAAALAPPTGLEVWTTEGTKITLLVKEIPNATSYTLYWSPSPGVSKSSQKIENFRSGFSHSGLTVGTSYYYKVAAVIEGEETALSPEVSASTQAEPSLSGPICFNNSGVIVSELGANNDVYVGGSFSAAGKCIGGFVALDGISAKPASTIASLPSVIGSVWAQVDDGKGGWFLIGSFMAINGVGRQNIAHLFADGKLDLNWNPTINGAINTLVRIGTKLYIGGTFTAINSVNRFGLAALNTETGVLEDWNPSTVNMGSGVFKTMAARGNELYVGGAFASVGGLTRANLMSVDANSGSISNWAPAVLPATTSGPVNIIVVKGNTIYVGGAFTSIDANTRTRLASFDGSNSNLLTSWMPNLSSGTASSLLVDDESIYVGGSFTSIAGQTRQSVARFVLSTGAISTAFNASLASLSSVNTMTKLNGSLILGGQLTHSTVDRRNLIAIDLLTGNVQSSWSQNVGGTVLALTTVADKLFVGGDVRSLETVVQKGLARLCLTGQLLPFAFGATSGGAVVNALKRDGNMLYVGGTFSTINATSRTNFAAIDLSAQSISTLNVAVAGTGVRAIEMMGSDIVIGGVFTTVGGTSKPNLAMISSLGVLSSSFSPAPNASVEKIIWSGTNFYVAGAFTNIGGQSRSKLASLNTDGSATAWTPNPNNTVNSLNLVGNTLYAAGAFNSILGTSRNYSASFDLSGGTLLPVGFQTSSVVVNLLATPYSLYLFGPFGGAGVASANTTRAKGASFTLSPATLTSFVLDSDPSGTVYQSFLQNNKLYLFGSFQSISKKARSGFAVVDAASGQLVD